MAQPEIRSRQGVLQIDFRRRAGARGCGNMSGSSAPRAATATIGCRKKPGERTGSSSKSIVGASGPILRTRKRVRSRFSLRIVVTSPPCAVFDWRLRPRVPVSWPSDLFRVGEMINLSRFVRYERSSIGRAPVSKTGGWGFDSLRSCCREAVFGPPRSSMRAGGTILVLRDRCHGQS
jgi:hypothetical protein